MDKILVIQPKMIGDVLTSSIFFEVLRTQYPKAKLHYLIYKHTYPVVENHPCIDEFIYMPPKENTSIKNFYNLMNAIRNENYDCVIDPYSKVISALISSYSGAKIRIASRKWYTSIFYTHTYSNLKPAKTNSGLAIENRLQLLQPVCQNVPSIVKPKIYLTQSEIDKAKNVLIKASIDLDQPLFMISVLGSNKEKTYPKKYMAAVIDTIVSESDGQLIFNYIPSQMEEAHEIYALCNAESQKHIHLDVFGKDLREFIAITGHCNALIGNEGGAVNMAKAIEVPTFTIFSPWILKEAWNLFENRTTNISVHLRDYIPDIYEGIEHPKVLKAKSLELYEQFKPELFTNRIKHFLAQF